MSKHKKKEEENVFTVTPEQKKKFDKEKRIRRGEEPRPKMRKVEQKILSEERLKETCKKISQIIEQGDANEIFANAIDRHFVKLGTDPDIPATTEFDLYQEVE